MLKKTAYIASALCASGLIIPGLIHADMMADMKPRAPIEDAAYLSGHSQPKHIVELFTSQGCSSCPVSNRLLTEISHDQDALALTYSVDYWDYLGWKDTFARPLFKDRQRSYSNALGHGRVYTPQMVVNGRLDAPRISPDDISEQAPIEAVLKVTISPSGTVELSQQLQAAKPLNMDGPATVRLISYKPGTQEVRVGGGENGGRVLRLTNVVNSVRTLGTYQGSDLKLEAGDFDAALAYAVLVQQEDNGPIMGAASFLP